MQNDLPSYPLFTTAFAPPIAYLAMAMQSDTACIEACENFEKQTYRNRFRIMTDKGIRDLSIPVQHRGGQKIPIREVMTDEKQAWRRLHWRTINAAYRSSPYFIYMKDELEPIVLGGSDRLFDLNAQIMEWVLKSIHVKLDICLTTEFQLLRSANDFRDRFHPRKEVIPNPPYLQVFSDRLPFAPGLSILDLIFNLGPEARQYLISL